jgi:hypothetical protein
MAKLFGELLFGIARTYIEGWANSFLKQTAQKVMAWLDTKVHGREDCRRTSPRPRRLWFLSDDGPAVGSLNNLRQNHHDADFALQNFSGCWSSLGALTREFRADLLASSVNSIRNFASNRVQAKPRLHCPKA